MTNVYTTHCPVYVGSYKMYNSCRLLLQDSAAKELLVDSRAISANFRITDKASEKTRTWGPDSLNAETLLFIDEALGGVVNQKELR